VLAAAAEIAEEAEAEAEIAPGVSGHVAAATSDLVDEIAGNGDGTPVAIGPAGDNGWGYSPPRLSDGTDGDNVEVGS
jgi:hypothetical protein